MPPEHVERMRVAFPTLFAQAGIECEDKWFPLLMSFAAKLESVLKGGSETATSDAVQVSRVFQDEEGGLKVELQGPATDEVADLLADLDAASRGLTDGRVSEHPYFWQHRVTEQTVSEEIVRADKADEDPAALQRDTVARAAGASVEGPATQGEASTI